jgi:t-SNARE complex subunit (syntaxin)
MLVRDRTEEFNSLMNFRGKYSDTHGLMQQETAIVEIITIPKWITSYNDFIEKYKTLKNYIRKEYAEYCRNANTVRMTETTINHEEKIEEMNIHINTNLKYLKNILDNFQSIFESDKGDDDFSQQELAVINNIKIYFSILFNSLGKSYNKIEFQYEMNKKRQDNTRKKFSQQFEGASERIEKYPGDILGQDTINDELRYRVELNEKIIEERFSEIATIVKSAKQIHQMFSDLNAIVIEHGTILDRIDKNMDKTYDHTRKAKEELIQTVKEQKKGNNFFIPCLCFLVVLIMILVGLIIMKN